jgi:hypothetical protein
MSRPAKFRQPLTETIHADMNSADEVVGHYFHVEAGRAVLKYYRPTGSRIDGFLAPDPTRYMLVSMA